MNVLKNLFGPKSKYDNSIPYTYEARILVVEGSEIWNSYFSATICGLIEYLNENNINPEDVQLFEIYQKQEFPINTEFCLTPEGQWLFRPDICRSFRKHYKGHIEEGKCAFKDRNRKGCGP
jgi:hypothetical protein